MRRRYSWKRARPVVSAFQERRRRGSFAVAGSALFSNQAGMGGPFTRRRSRARGKSLWAVVLRALGLLRIARMWVRRNGVIVLTFHRVLAEAELNQTASLPGMIVGRHTFDRFLEYATTQCEV